MARWWQVPQADCGEVAHADAGGAVVWSRERPQAGLPRRGALELLMHAPPSVPRAALEAWLDCLLCTGMWPQLPAEFKAVGCRPAAPTALQELPGVFSAREFVWWYNGHPAYRNLPVDLSRTRSVAIAGLGNVAGERPACFALSSAIGQRMPLAVGHQPTYAPGLGCFLCPVCARLAVQPPPASRITRACTQALLSLLGALPPNPARSLRTCTGPPRHAAHAPTVCVRPPPPGSGLCPRAAQAS